MIIVEGPDGAGKTRLVEMIAARYGLPIAPRVVKSNTSALVDLRSWTEHNLERGFHAMIYDRHRLLSDPIYHSVLPWRMSDHLYDFPWLASMWRDFTNIRPFIVYCLPPKKVVLANIEDDVTDNATIRPYAGKLYDAYVAQAAMFRWAPMYAATYDYTTDDPNNPRFLEFLETALKRLEK